MILHYLWSNIPLNILTSDVLVPVVRCLWESCC